MPMCRLSLGEVDQGRSDIRTRRSRTQDGDLQALYVLCPEQGSRRAALPETRTLARP
jgi:hypothetical protein